MIFAPGTDPEKAQRLLDEHNARIARFKDGMDNRSFRDIYNRYLEQQAQQQDQANNDTSRETYIYEDNSREFVIGDNGYYPDNYVHPSSTSTSYDNSTKDSKGNSVNNKVSYGTDVSIRRNNTTTNTSNWGDAVQRAQGQINSTRDKAYAASPQSSVFSPSYQGDQSPNYSSPVSQGTSMDYKWDRWDRVPYEQGWDPYRAEQAMENGKVTNTVSYDTSITLPGSTNFQKGTGNSVGQDYSQTFGGYNDKPQSAQDVGGWNIQTDSDANISAGVNVELGEDNDFGAGATIGNNYAISFINQGRDNPFSNMEKATQYNALNDNFLERSRGRVRGSGRSAAATSQAESVTDIRNMVASLYNEVGQSQKAYGDGSTTARTRYFGDPTSTPSWKAPSDPKEKEDSYL